MNRFTPLAAGLCLALLSLGTAQAQANRAEVIHWWTSGGESAALQELASAYKAAGGTWVDNAIAGGEPARATAINRMVGGNPSTAAQFTDATGAGLAPVEAGAAPTVITIAFAPDFTPSAICTLAAASDA